MRRHRLKSVVDIYAMKYKEMWDHYYAEQWEAYGD